MPASPDDIIAGLTDAQREAVTYGEGPLLVVAGAGSGKTRVITRRIACLLARGVPPDRVLAMTFTNKAADEMRRRVEALVGREVLVSTFHSYCARLLRREIGRIDRDPAFTIYDRADSLRVVRRIVKDMELDPATFPPAEVLDFIAVRKDRVEGPSEWKERALGIQEQTFAALYARYEERLAESNALDFDDLLLKTLEVFRRCPDVLRYYQETYRHVLVDEYQDTNLPQHLIARALQGKHRNITAVGDPDQMIYSWRGARLENLMAFEEDFPGTRVVTLERNYRSSGIILRATSACIDHNVFRRPKRLWTEREEGGAVVVAQFGDPYQEGRWVAERAAELVEQGHDPRQVAVFYRTKLQSAPLEDAFATLALPHQVVDSVGFFERREVKDLRAYLQLLLNPRDDESCLRIINTPPRGIGARTVERLRAAAAGRGCSLMEAVREAERIESLNARARGAVAGFRELYRQLSAQHLDGVADLIGQVVEHTGYLARRPADERADAEEIVDLFLGYARQYDQREPEGGLLGFLEQAALVSDVDGWNAQASAVPFMTLHSAKGLEFDAVFIVGVEEEVLPHRRALEECIQGSEEAALEEERRLFYVGMTRARHRLFLTCARRRRIRGREEEALPSRFLDELPEDCVERQFQGRPGAGGAGASAFAAEMEYVLKKKRSRLRVLDNEEGRLAPGVRVSHPHWGEGEILESAPVGSRHMVRVHFVEHGTMTLILGAGDAGPA
ncbi:MAG: ATP-dependent helicase [Planctomycetota bacterium]|jgi:DNA helicase-2/ATP-dependent DNA helicase PcrA